jgi:hypothetical protein
MGALAPSAQAEDEFARVSMTSSGLLVDVSHLEARVNIDTGEPGQWEVFVTNPDCTVVCAEGADAGAGCSRSLTSIAILCEKTASGVTVSMLGGGDDRVFPRIGSQRGTFHLGGGDDDLENSVSAIGGTPAATGPWTVDAGSGNDRIVGSSGGNTIDAGPGDDNIRGFPTFTTFTGAVLGQTALSAGDSIDGDDGDDTIDPGKGSDQVIGGEGDDYFKAGDESTIPGDFDSYDGGSGIDTIDYSSRTTDIFFNSGSVQSGSVGANPDEQDRVSGTNNVILGSGNDIAFSLLENLSKRRYEGRDGDDVLNGLDSPDTLIGGGGADKLNGFKGNDTIDARSDSFADKLISCGAGTDKAEIDLKDPLPVDWADHACETFIQGAAAEPAFVGIRSATRTADHHLQVKLKCPKANKIKCAGTLRVHAKSRHYSIGAGRSARVGLGRVSGRKVNLTATEPGSFGPETVVRLLRVR